MTTIKTLELAERWGCARKTAEKWLEANGITVARGRGRSVANTVNAAEATRLGPPPEGRGQNPQLSDEEAEERAQSIMLACLGLAPRDERDAEVREQIRKDWGPYPRPEHCPDKAEDE